MLLYFLHILQIQYATMFSRSLSFSIQIIVVRWLLAPFLHSYCLLLSCAKDEWASLHGWSKDNEWVDNAIMLYEKKDFSWKFQEFWVGFSVLDYHFGSGAKCGMLVVMRWKVHRPTTCSFDLEGFLNVKLMSILPFCTSCKILHARVIYIKTRHPLSQNLEDTTQMTRLLNFRNDNTNSNQ